MGSVVGGSDIVVGIVVVSEIDDGGRIIIVVGVDCGVWRRRASVCITELLVSKCTE